MSKKGTKNRERPNKNTPIRTVRDNKSPHEPRPIMKNSWSADWWPEEAFVILTTKSNKGAEFIVCENCGQLLPAELRDGRVLIKDGPGNLYAMSFAEIFIRCKCGQETSHRTSAKPKWLLADLMMTETDPEKRRIKNTEVIRKYLARKLIYNKRRKSSLTK